MRNNLVNFNINKNVKLLIIFMEMIILQEIISEIF